MSTSLRFAIDCIPLIALLIYYYLVSGHPISKRMLIEEFELKWIMFTLGFSITTAAISSLSEVSKSGAIFTNTGVLLFAKESLASSTLLIKASRACFPCNLLNPGVFGLKLIGKGKKTL